ncbi:MAG TPA: gliding motility-associated C-terminal domain-containing protein, partial [Chitinophagaceae bacterium]|nr:gliding motility-associated C-terminal domain-containing protein [Chitinophagaceae bacterium]
NPVAAMPLGSTGNIYTYTVTASTSAGCMGVASATLKVYKGPDIYVPTGFTPNADGKNDKFYPITVGIKEINYFKVFNRWGQLVFFTSKLNEGWDGKLGGIQQSTGVYVWIVQATTRDGRVITKKGTVMLIR